MRPIRPATLEQTDAAAGVLEHLRIARQLARKAGSPRTLARIRSALKSAEGAHRHIAYRYHRSDSE
ncbi:hypothetical protein [Qipengyuania citrea]|uniref:hypothetical protein n=1 Tax=Qipengyuania citrea TaxID=225971 RepID=UPI003299D22B